MKVAEDLRRAVLQAAIEGKLTGGSLENWRFVRLGDIALSIQYGYNAPAREEGTVKMVRISDIQNNNIQWNNVPYCELSEDEMQKYLLAKNDILFARTGGTVGKSYLVANMSEKAIYAGYLIRMRLNDEVNPQYVKYFMESESYWKQLRNGTTATAQPNCNGKTLSQMIIPLPPLNEQHRIVSRLDSILPLIAELESAENELEALERKFPGDMRDSLIQAAIEGRLTGNNTDNWRYVRLGDVITKDIGGGTPDKSVAEYWNGKIPWMSVKDFARANDGFIEDTIDHISEQGLEHSATNLIMPGAIIICMRMGLGKYARLKRPTAINQDLRAIWLSEDVLADYFLYFYSTLKIEGIGTTVKGIKRNELLSYIISLPPINEQQKIVSRLNDLLPLCEALERII